LKSGAKDKRRLPVPPTGDRALSTDRATSSPLVAPKAKVKFSVPLGEYVVAVTKSGAFPGHLRFHGKVEFEKGAWCGVELTTAKGNNDGSVKGVQYFTCEENHGVFVLQSKVSKLRKPK
jgi:hypothetical protein